MTKMDVIEIVFIGLILVWMVVAGAMSFTSKTQAALASSYAACRSMDAFPVMTPDSGVACVTQAVLVADTLPPDSLQGEVR